MIGPRFLHRFHKIKWREKIRGERIHEVQFELIRWHNPTLRLIQYLDWWNQHDQIKSWLDQNHGWSNLKIHGLIKVGVSTLSDNHGSGFFIRIRSGLLKKISSFTNLFRERINQEREYFREKKLILNSSDNMIQQILIDQIKSCWNYHVDNSIRSWEIKSKNTWSDQSGCRCTVRRSQIKNPSRGSFKFIIILLKILEILGERNNLERGF